MALSQGVNEPTQEEIEKTREELGLNAPLTVQYGRWISQALRGDLGETSYLTKKPVLEELKRRAPDHRSCGVFFISACDFDRCVGRDLSGRSKKGDLIPLSKYA